MIKKLLLTLSIPCILLLGSCVSTKTAQVSDQNDDVYYSLAKAKEIIPQTIVQNEDRRVNDYVTDENLYGDIRDDYGYYNDYASRFNRFGTFAPALGYYNSFYGYNYDPFFSNMYFPNSYFGGSAFNLGFGFNTFNYNPWRTFGYNYGFGSNIWNPYANYNSFNYGNGYYGGTYAGIYSSPAFNAPNYRSRPSRTSDNLGIYRGAVNGNPNSIGSGSTNNNAIQRSRAERYGVQTQPNAGATQNSGTRTQQVNRPERVNQAPPQRAAQPERTNTAPPRQDSGSRSNPAPSNNSGGGSSSRPSRGN
jgi:hypothetical protein